MIPSPRLAQTIVYYQTSQEARFLISKICLAGKNAMPSDSAQEPEPSIDSFRSLLSKAKAAWLVRQLKQNRKRR